MRSTFLCQHCGETVLCNPCVKNQKYCSSKECRRASRRFWKRKNYASNKSYRQKCLKSQKVWREQRPAHQYQQEYRESHPEYVKHNRALQRKRNKKRQKSQVPTIVNRNTLSLQPGDGHTYALMQVKDGKIVNRNTFMVRMQVLSGKEMVLAQTSV
jgi:hypothetical protein